MGINANQRDHRDTKYSIVYQKRRLFKCLLYGLFCSILVPNIYLNCVVNHSTFNYRNEVTQPMPAKKRKAVKKTVKKVVKKAKKAVRKTAKKKTAKKRK